MAKIVQKETLRHKETFEYYYSLGDKRSLAQAGQKFGITKQAVEIWSRSFNWQSRVEQRDIENAKKLAEKTDRIIVNTKADYREEIKKALFIVRGAIQTAIRMDAEGKPKLAVGVQEVTDISSLANTYEKLVKLDLILMGEAAEREERIVTFRDV